MPDQLQLRGGTTAQHTSFTGASKEVTVDTTKKTAVVHDGATAGGNPLLREDGSNSALSLGSAGTPSLKFTGDPNTGIYSPGADQVAISTNGTGRLFVNASGNVGVGTTSPSFLLTCATSADGVDGVSVESPSLNGVIRLRADGTNGNAIRVGGVGAQGNTLRFLVGSDVERMRIDSSGRLGLGSTLAGNANNRLLVRSDSASAISNVLLLNNGPADNNAGQGVRINLSGVSEANSNIRYAYIEAANQTSSNDHYLAFGTNSAAATPTERLRITSAGNVGIGTTTPSDALQVASGNILIGTGGSSAGYRALYFGASSTASARFAYIEKNNDSPFDFNIVAQSSTTASSAINFKTTPTSTAATIDSSGRLLVGTSTSNQIGALDTQIQLAGTSGGTSLFSLQRYSNNSSSAGIYIGKSRGTSAGSFTAVQQDDVLGDIRFYGANGTDLSNLGAIIRAEVDGEPFTAGDTTDLPGRLVFLTTLDGAGSSTEAFRITNDRVRCYNQAAPAAVDTTATLTVANLKTGIITSSTAAAVTMTLPTGTDTEAGFSGVYTNMTFEWAVINTGATNAVTIAAGTGHTIVGSATVAASNSGRFATRRTAANTFVTYRLSS
jgi:hypothetical protein